MFYLQDRYLFFTFRLYPLSLSQTNFVSFSFFRIFQTFLQHPLGHISQSDIEKRAAYFREQRNKIFCMKQAIRDQQLKV